jgi:hypothetical protein
MSVLVLPLCVAGGWAFLIGEQYFSYTVLFRTVRSLALKSYALCTSVNADSVVALRLPTVIFKGRP